jgi:hypothetical protein
MKDSEMKHPQQEILQAFALDTSVEIEGSRNGGMWYTTSIDSVIFYPERAFRLKPKERCVTIDGVEFKFPEPLRVAPEVGTTVYVISVMHGVTAYCYGVQFKGLDYAIKAGFCQATEAGAEAQRRAIIALTGGVE